MCSVREALILVATLGGPTMFARIGVMKAFANGKLFEISTGMFLNGKWTWPGVEPGCRCISKSVIPGFS
jgi:hypothetical protein